MMRLAWFSPLSPRVSGLAMYSAAIVAALAPDADIDVFVDDDDPADLAPRLGGSVAVRPAHDFVWMQARRPYDLTVYQLANAASHAYLWGYAVRYPGLAVLHDQVLHHARGAHLRRAHHWSDYRAEVRLRPAGSRGERSRPRRPRGSAPAGELAAGAADPRDGASTVWCTMPPRPRIFGPGIRKAGSMSCA